MPTTLSPASFKTLPQHPGSAPRSMDLREDLRGIRVYCYHGVVERRTDAVLERNFEERAEFIRQVEFIRSRYRLISAAELAEELYIERTGPPRAVMTFDDGYLNNQLVGEILAEREIPWVLFVTTSAVGRLNCIWTVELSLLMLHGQSAAVELPDGPLDLRTRSARVAAFNRVRRRMKRLPGGERAALMDRIRGQFPAGETGRLLEAFPSLQMLRWDEVRELAQRGVEIGSHGLTHEIHHRAQSADVRRRELVDSRRGLEEQLGEPCRFFAFPNGDFHPGSAGEVRDAGYELGFTFTHAPPGATSPYLLPRYDPPSRLRRLLSLVRPA